MPRPRKADIPGISDAEWEVMKVLWDQHPIPASEVAERLAGRRDWSPRTVKTLLNRLVRKGALAFETEGRRYLYRPTVSRTECVRRASQSFLRRVFGGSAGPMLVHFVKNSRLSDAEIEALRRTLDEKREG